MNRTDIYIRVCLHLYTPNKHEPWISTTSHKTSSLINLVRGNKRIRRRGVCHRERSHWFPAAPSRHTAHWGVLRRPALSSFPPSLTQRQTWGKKVKRGPVIITPSQHHIVAVQCYKRKMLSASVKKRKKTLYFMIVMSSEHIHTGSWQQLWCVFCCTDI